jgi:hypothetical protein
MSRYWRLKIEGGASFYTLALADHGSNLLVRHIERPPHTFPASYHSLTHLLPLMLRIESFRDVAFRQANERGSELVIRPRFARSRWRLCAPYACYKLRLTNKCTRDCLITVQRRSF